MSRAYLIADLEGVSGVDGFDERDDRSPGLVRRRGRYLALWAEEVAAAVAGAAESGAQEVLVLDNHGPGDGLSAAILPAPARLIHGRGRPTWLPCLDESTDAILFVGQHAMAGTDGGHLCHTYSRRRLRRVVVNGTEVGEIGLAAAIAGLVGVPAAFLSGDERAAEELRNINPAAVCVSVKQGLSRLSCVSLPVAEAREAIREGVGRALAAVDNMGPTASPQPTRIRLHYRARDAWRAPLRALRRPRSERWVGLGKVEVLGADVRQAWDRAIGLRGS